MKSTPLFLVLLLFIGCDSNDDEKTTADQAAVDYVNELVDALQASAVNRKTIDWTSFRSELLAAVPNSSKINDGLRKSLTLLQDGKAHAEHNKTRITSDDIKTCLLPGASGYSGADPKIASLFVVWSDQVDDTTQTTAIKNQIATKDKEDLDGWIIDLRPLNKGNFWMLLAAMGPLVGDGVSGHLIDPDGKASSWTYSKGKASIDGAAIFDFKNEYYELLASDKKIAVLINVGTSGPGEALAISFLGRPNTRFFGSSTCGVTTDLDSLEISDNTKIWLATRMMADREKNIKSVVTPDETIIDDDDLKARAVEWIKEQ